MPRAEQPVKSMSRVEYASIVQRAARVFALMRPMIDSPDSRLQWYRNDFYLHDRNYLRATHATGQYLWIVRESGTELRKLAMHPSENEWLRATMNITDARDMYLVDADHMSISNVLDDEHAERLMNRFRYSLQEGVIAKDDVPLVQISTKIVWEPTSEHGQRNVAHVTLTSLRQVPEIEHAALVSLAAIHARERAQSLFTPVGNITLDGQDLYAQLTPAVAALDSRSTWYGVIHALPDEADFLRSLKIELGPFDQDEQGFPARLTGEAMANLDPYSGSMNWELQRLPWTIKPEGAIEPVKPLSRLTGAHLRAYDAALAWEVINCAPATVPAVTAAREALSIEQARRSAPRARLVTAPGGAGLSLG